MQNEQDWENPLEDDGITLGPEEALSREIEKSKRLKVERLKLRDEIEKLKAKNESLAQKNREMKNEIKKLGSESVAQAHSVAFPDSPKSKNHAYFQSWLFFLLIFNLSALGILLYFLLES